MARFGLERTLKIVWFQCLVIWGIRGFLGGLVADIVQSGLAVPGAAGSLLHLQEEAAATFPCSEHPVPAPAPLRGISICHW